jgi:hypothetical protein
MSTRQKSSLALFALHLAAFLFIALAFAIAGAMDCPL